MIWQMFTFYPLLRFESCWTLTFHSLQVINALYASLDCRKLTVRDHVGLPARTHGQGAILPSRNDRLSAICSRETLSWSNAPVDTAPNLSFLMTPLCTSPWASRRAPEETWRQCLTSCKLSYCIQDWSIEYLLVWINLCRYRVVLLFYSLRRFWFSTPFGQI